MDESYPFSVELFEAQRKRRFGTANPERISNEHWDWMIRTRQDPTRVCHDLGILDSENRFSAEKPWQPDWCFERFGVTRTRIPDGRIVCIAGEHEDWYDPDFCVYNDVVVFRATQAPGVGEEVREHIEIYAYPEDIFTCTDFHSATLVGDKIYIIGSLWVEEGCESQPTPVYLLDTNVFSIEKLECHADHPGWVSRHHASYDQVSHSIFVRGGQRLGEDALNESQAVHRLWLDDNRWELIKEKDRHRRFMYHQTIQGQLSRFRDRWMGGWDGLDLAGINHTRLDTQRGFGDSLLDIAFDIEGIRVTMKLRVLDADVPVEVTRILVEGSLPEDTLESMLAQVELYLFPDPDDRSVRTEVDSFDDL